MLYFSSRQWILVFLVVTCLAASCVGKGKYYAAMQQQAATKSELGITQIDLGDARSEVLRQDALVSGLRAEINRLGNDVTTLSDQSRNEQLQIGASLNKTQEQLERHQARLVSAEKQLDELKRYHGSRDKRLSEIGGQLGAALATLPNSQLSTSKSNEEVVFRFGEGLFFIRNGSKISDYGNALILKLAGSLGGQKDLLIDVVAYPSIATGSMKSWQSASERANAIAHELVSRYGLSPKQVSATGRLGEIVVIDGAPAESKQRKTVEIIVRLNPLRYPMPVIE